MRVLVCPARHVTSVLSATRVERIISLVSPGAALELLAEDGPARDVLRFHDIDEARKGLVAPSRADVEAILQAAQEVETLLIHCHAGISRSTAALLTVACWSQPSRSPNDIAMALRKASPQATPNRRIIGFADEILRCEGRLTAAVAAIGRGEDAYEGNVIDWDLGPL
jgi:predicted protein tyrosine phosphatase